MSPLFFSKYNCEIKLFKSSIRLINQIRRPCTTVYNNIKTLNDMPGLAKLPVIGTLHHFLPIIGSVGLIENFFKLSGYFHEKFGPFVKMDGIFFRSTMVILYEPEDYDQVTQKRTKEIFVCSLHFEESCFNRTYNLTRLRDDAIPFYLLLVYRAEEDNPLRPGFDSIVYYREELRRSTYDGVYGLTTAQGTKWRDFRTKVNPALLKLKLVKLYSPGIEDIAQEVVERIKKLTRDDPTYLQNNFNLEMTKYSLESVAYVGLGARLGCLKDNLSENHPAMKLMTCAKSIVDWGFHFEFRPKMLKRVQTPTFKKLIKALDTQWDISAMYIEEAKRNIKNRDNVAEEDKSIIEKLLAIDEKVAVMMANEMLLAGIDTVAFVTTALLYNLATNPEKQQKVRKEVRSGTDNRRYLKACIKESLRIWPVIPANLRKTSKDHVVGGYLIPAGVEVIAPNEYLSKLEKYYPRPLEFLPERWLVNKSDPMYYGNAHPMVTLPFGFGVRSCIGRRIAELEIETLIARIIDEFTVSWNGPPVKVVTKIMNMFEKPYNFSFESAK